MITSYFGEGAIASPTTTSCAPSWRTVGHVSTGEPRQLYREVADAAGRTCHEHAFSEQRPALAERVERRQPRHRERGGLRERDLVGQLGQSVLRDDHSLGPRTFRQESDNARSDARPRAVRRGALDDSCEIPAGSPSGRGHARAANLPAVERDGVDAHERFAPVGGGLGHRADDEPPRRGRVHDDGEVGGHGLSPWGSFSRAAASIATPPSASRAAAWPTRW